MCGQNTVKSRLTVLCQDIAVHRELNAGNIGGPWASLFYPLVSLEQTRFRVHMDFMQQVVGNWVVLSGGR